MRVLTGVGVWHGAGVMLVALLIAEMGRRGRARRVSRRPEGECELIVQRRGSIGGSEMSGITVCFVKLSQLASKGEFVLRAAGATLSYGWALRHL